MPVVSSESSNILIWKNLVAEGGNAEQLVSAVAT